MELLAALAAYLKPSVMQLWGADVSRAECLGMGLALWMVGCNMRVHPLGWPLACLSSLLYAVVFFDSRLYGEAALQLFFAAMAVWGLFQWLGRGVAQGHDPGQGAPGAGIRVLPKVLRTRLWGLGLLGWLALGALLRWRTDSDVPFWDALPTIGSVLGTWLLARKYLENWGVWLGVNLVSIGLFAYKALWPTAALYAVFALLSAWGWKTWRAQLDAAAEATGETST